MQQPRAIPFEQNFIVDSAEGVVEFSFQEFLENARVKVENMSFKVEALVGIELHFVVTDPDKTFTVEQRVAIEGFDKPVSEILEMKHIARLDYPGGYDRNNASSFVLHQGKADVILRAMAVLSQEQALVTGGVALLP
jgi:hypothetical protein